MSDKSLNISPPKVNETPYSEWEATSNYTNPSIESFTKYSDHVRSQWQEAGLYDEFVEQDITTNFTQALIDFDFLTEENKDEVALEIEKVYTPDPLKDAEQVLAYNPYTGDFKQRADYITPDYYPRKKPKALQALEDFQSSDEIVKSEDLENIKKFTVLSESGGISEDDPDLPDMLESIRRGKEATYKEMYKRGEVFSAVYQDEKGDNVFLGGEIPEGMSPSDVLKAGSEYGVTPKNFLELEYWGSEVSTSNNLPRHAIKKRYHALADIANFVDSKASFEEYQEKIDGLSEAYAHRTTYDTGDTVWNNVTDFLQENLTRPLGSGLAGIIGDEGRQRQITEESLYEDAQEYYADNFDEIREGLILEIHKSTGHSMDVVQDAIDQIVVNNADAKNMLLFHGDEEDMAKNVHKGVFQLPIVHSSLLAQKEKFKDALDKAGVSPEVQQLAEQKRVFKLTETFKNKSDVLQEEYGDKWNEAVIDGRQQGLKNHEIIEKFAQDEENFSEAWARTEGILYSVGAEGFGTLFYGVGAMLGSDWARQGLDDIQEGRAHRNELASIFGMERGYWTEVGEAIAPMLVDMTLTGVMAAGAVPTAGASLAVGAGYLGAKTSTQVAAKSVLKQAFAGTLKVAKGETLEMAAQRVLGKQLLGDVPADRVLSVVKAYNSQLASKIGIVTATFVPAATRSATNTYGTVFKNVSDDLTAKHKNADGSWQTGWSAERVKENAHDYALGGALSAGTITGIITSAMGSIGRGGMEDALLKGMTYGQMKQIGQNVLGRNLGDISFQKVLKKSIDTVLKKQRHGVLKQGVLRNAFDEGIEEALDEFLNGFIIDIASNRDTPILERFQQAWHAAQIGATIGAGTSAIGSVARRVAPDRFTDTAALARFEQSLFQQYEQDVIAEELTEGLRASGSPTTAAEVERIVRQYKRAEPTTVEPNAEEDALKFIEDQSEEGIQEDADRIEKELNKASEKTISEIANRVITNTNQTPAPDPSIAGSEAASTILQGSEGETKTGKNHVTSTHSSKQLEYKPDENLKRVLKQIENKYKKYQELVKEINESPLSKDAGLEVKKKNLEALLDRGDVVEKASYDALVKQAKARHNLEVKKLKEAEARGITEAEEKAIESIVETGYPHTLGPKQLDKLGISLENADSATLSALSKEAQKRTNKRFPTLPTSMPEGGASLPRAYGKAGKVYVDSNGAGVFNNDPVGMLTLIESNIPVVVPKSKIEKLRADGKLNPSLRFREQGDQMVLEDIMVHESGGVVSAKTAFNRVGVLEEDYSSISELASENSRLRQEVEVGTDLKVTSPLTGRKVKATTLLEQSSDLTRLKEVFASNPEITLNKDFIESAVVALSLDLQNSAYRYINKINNNESVETAVADLKALTNKHSNYFTRQQVERSKRAKRSLVAIMEPDTDIHNDAAFDVEENGSDSSYVPPRTSPQEPISQRKLVDYVSSIHAGGASALSTSPELFNRVKDLLSTEYYTGKDISRFTPEQTFEALMHFMAKGNAVTNQKAVDFQVAIKNGELGEAGQVIRNSFRLLALSSPSVELSPSKDADYLALIKQELQILSGSDQDITTTKAVDFFKDVRKAVDTFYARALMDGRSQDVNAERNNAQVSELGLVSGDPESVISALEKISRGKNKVQALIARVLLQNKPFIRSVNFEIENTRVEYAGVFTIDANGNSVVSINVGRSSPRGIADVLLHEYVHAATTRITRLAPESRSDAENKAIRRLEAILNLVKKKAESENAPDSILYGTKNLEEFIAVFLTSPKFQEYVKSLGIEAGERSLFRRILDAIGVVLNRGKLSQQFNKALESSLDLTLRGINTEPETEASFRDQVARSIHGSQTRRASLASLMGMGKDAGVAQNLDQQAKTYSAWAADFVPSEINIVMDNTTDVIAEWDGETQSIIFNGRRAAAYINHIVAKSGGKKINREHIIGAILNEEIAHAASYATLSEAEIQSIMDSLTEADTERIITQYYPENERQAARDRLMSTDENVVQTEKFVLAEESLRIHAQKVLTGTETNEQVDFLIRNPSLVEIFVNYLKKFVEKITYHKKLDQISPEMRIAVNRITREIRAMKADYRATPNGMRFDINNPEASLEKFVQQLIAQKNVRMKGEEPETDTELTQEEEAQPPLTSTLQSRLGSAGSLPLDHDGLGGLTRGEVVTAGMGTYNPLPDDAIGQPVLLSHTNISLGRFSRDKEGEFYDPNYPIGVMPFSLEISMDEGGKKKSRKFNAFNVRLMSTDAKEVGVRLVDGPYKSFIGGTSAKFKLEEEMTVGELINAINSAANRKGVNSEIKLTDFILTNPELKGKGLKDVVKEGTTVYTQGAKAVVGGPTGTLISANEEIDVASLDPKEWDLLAYNPATANYMFRISEDGNGVTTFHTDKRFTKADEVLMVSNLGAHQEGETNPFKNFAVWVKNAQYEKVDPSKNENDKPTHERLREVVDNKQDKPTPIKRLQSRQGADIGGVFWENVNSAQTVVDATLEKGADEMDSGIKGSKVHELAKFMRNLMSDKEVIDWSKNWRGLSKDWKEPRKKKAFFNDVSQMGDRLAGVLERALNEYPEFVSWYESRVNMAMDIFAELDEDAKNPEDSFVLKTLMTVTSNGNKVKEQTEDSWALYQNWKKTGKLAPTEKFNPDRQKIEVTKTGKEKVVPVSWIRGDRQSQIKDHLRLIDKMVEDYSWQEVSDFLSKSGTVKELRQELEDKFGFKNATAKRLTNGELIDENVPFSLIFGAKLGSFYNNLNGDFDTITMDRWFMRTFGRTAGAQIRKATRKELSEKKARFDKALAKYLENDKSGQLLKVAGLGRKRKRSVDMVLALEKHWTSAENRQKYFDPKTKQWMKFSGEMSAASPLDNELRLATNGLSKIIDGFELVEAPTSGAHRRFIRLAMTDAIAKLETIKGVRMVPAEAQAILWYYEKALHAEYGSGTDEAPDYASAANEVFRAERGVDGRDFTESTANVRRRGLLGSDIGLPEHRFEILEDGRLVGYRASRFQDGKAVSGADSRQNTPLQGNIALRGGLHVSNDPNYVIQYYAGHESNVIQKIAFREEDILQGDITSSEPELRIVKGESLEHEVLSEDQVGDGVKSSFKLPSRLQSRYGANSYIPNELDSESLDFTPFMEMLDVPLYQVGDWEAPRTRLNKFWQLLFGYGNKDIRDFKTDRDGFVRETKHIAEKFKADHDRIIKEAQDRGVEIPASLISKASGSNRGSQLTDEQADFVEKEYRKEKNNDPTDEGKALAKLNRIENINKIRQSNLQVMIEERNKALSDLLAISPEMHALIVSARKVVDELSLKGNEIFKDTFSKKEFAMTFDNQRGIYIVRRYRMFDDSDFAQRVRKDPAYKTARTEAINFFADEHLKYTAKQIKNESAVPLTEAEAMESAKDEAFAETDRETRGSQMLDEFLKTYEDKSFRKEFEEYTGADLERRVVFKDRGSMSNSLGDLLKKFNNEKNNIPSPLRKILGEYDDQSGIENILFTIVHAGSVMANQQMQNNIVDHGSRGSNPWLITKKEFLEDEKQSREDPDYEPKYEGWMQMKSDGSSLDWSPFKGKYARPDAHESLRNLFHTQFREAETIHGKLYLAIVRALQKLTGAAMGMKTLGSATFYQRNMYGNALFFGPAQGYFGGIPEVGKEVLGTLGFGKADWREESMVVRAARGSRADMDAELSALRSVNVWGDELNAEVLRDLLLGNKTPLSIEVEIKDLSSQIDKLKAVKGSKKLLRRLSNKASALASAMDAYYKIGLYEFELDTLVRAAKSELDGESSTREFAHLLNEDGTPSSSMKKLAAKKVKMTAQSYSQALPFIKAITQTEAGLLIAPYVRFAAEVPRIVVNTQKLWWQESFSKNKVIASRGRKRFAGFMLTVPFFSITVPALLKKMAGIGEDEEEGLRKALPWYSATNTFYYFGKGKDLHRWNLTYFNPYSTVAEPFALGINDLISGKGVASAMGSTFKGMLKPYVGEQILVGAVTDVINNNDGYGNRIRVGEDEWSAENIATGLGYILKSAYGPRTPMKILQAIKAAGDPTVEGRYTPFEILLGELKPVRSEPVDLGQNFRRYLKNHVQDYRSFGFSDMTKQSEMTESDVGKLYDRVFFHRKRLNEELKRVMRGYNNLGLSWAEINNTLSSNKVGKDRVKYTYNGWMYRPVVPTPTRKIIFDKGKQIRLKWLEDHYKTRGHTNNFLPLDD